jgi:hypothetical protein
MRNTLRFLGYCALVAISLICIFRLSYGSKQTNDIKQANLVPIQALNNPEPTLENTPQNVENIENTATEETEEDMEEADLTLIKETSLAELKDLGWRFPKKADYQPEIYQEIKKYYKNEINGDFNGDGKMDKAILLVRDNENALESKESSVFIFLSQNKTSSNIYQSVSGDGSLSYGLRLQPAEHIELVGVSITLTNPAIEASPYHGCGGEIIFWDSDKNKFLMFYTGC